MSLFALEKLQDHLNCSVCLDTYTSPKQLQCHHVYCQKCLVRLVFRDQQQQLVLTCPNCRQITSLPANGVAGLQTAFHIVQLLEIVEEHKKAAVAASSPKKLQSASSISIPSEDVHMCSKHGRKEVELYCETCEETICWKCIMKGEKHHSHNYEEISSAFELFKQKLLLLFDPIEQQLVTVEAALAQLDRRHKEISDQRVIIEGKIHDTISHLHTMLALREAELISQLNQLTQTKIKSLAAQRDQLETTQVRLSSCLLFMREKFEAGNQTESLLKKNTTLRQVKDLTATFQSSMLEPSVEANTVFSVMEGQYSEIEKYGTVHVSGNPDPSKCVISFRKPDLSLSIGDEIVATLQVFDSEWQPCKEAATISCELFSAISSSNSCGMIVRREKCCYDIRHQLSVKGRHKLHITVDGRGIKGSPFEVHVLSSIMQLGPPLLAITEVKDPVGVAVSQGGEVVVTECIRHRVTIFSANGKHLRSFGTRGSGKGQFRHPCGVAVDNIGNILVTDNENHRIQKFTAQGEFLCEVGTQGSGPLHFNHPNGIAFNARNCLLYVVDSYNSCIQILNFDLSYFGTFGRKGCGKGQFKLPRYIACDSNGDVYVTDSDNHRIQVFTAKGRFLRMFGRRGEGRGELNQPRGIAVDSSDQVYVADSYNHRVSVFTSKGQLLTTFGSGGEGPGQFMCPFGLSVDSSGVVYVCDHRVQLF